MKLHLLLGLGVWLTVSVAAVPDEAIRLPKAAFVEKKADRYPVIQRREFTGAVIAVPADRPAGTPIRATVTGQVIWPGRQDLTDGTTVLEAINKPGGFSALAEPRDIRIRRGDQVVRLFFQKADGADGRPPRIWTIEAEKDPATGKWRAASESKEDYRIRDGDVITVGELEF